MEGIRFRQRPGNLEKKGNMGEMLNYCSFYLCKIAGRVRDMNITEPYGARV